MTHPDVTSARSLTTAALVLYAVFGLIFLGLGVFSFLFLFLGIVPFVMFLVVYATVREPLGRGEVARAATPALVLGILSLLLTNIISGILLLVAYAKISRAQSALETAAWRAAPAGGAASWAPGGQTGAGVPAGDMRYCPSCRAPLTPPYRYCTHCGYQVPGGPTAPAND